MFKKSACIISFLVYLLLFIALVEPLSFSYIASGLDPSWVSVVSEAQRLGLSFGTDIVFTTGPLSSLYHRFFNPTDAIFITCILIAYCFYISYCLTYLVKENPQDKYHLLIASACMFSVAILSMSKDSIFFLCPLLSVTVYFSGKRNIAFVFASTFFLSCLSLAKFSVFPLALLGTLIVDIHRIRSAKLPYVLGIYFLFQLIIFSVAGENPKSFIGYLRSSLEVTSGYSSAMSLRGSFFELVVWLVFCTAFLVFVVNDMIKNQLTLTERANWHTLLSSQTKRERKNKLNNLRHYWNRFVLSQSCLYLVFFLAFLWIGFKAGFVRHDLHSIVAWSNLVLASIVYILSRNTFIVKDISKKKSFYILYALTTVILILSLSLPFYIHDVPRPTNYFGFLKTVSQQVYSGFQLVFDAEEWIAGHKDSQETALQVVRDEYSLPEVDGTIDIIPSHQSAVIANGLNYQPRPTIQEYTTYSERLIERNRVFFSGERSPDYLLFAPGSIDNRYPTSAEGPLWPLFIRQYEPIERIHEMVLLGKRELPAHSGTVASEESYETNLFHKFLLPDHEYPLFIKIKVRYTLLGKLSSLLFKPPQLEIYTTYSGEIERQHRFIPAIAREGMIMSPLIEDTASYLELVQPDHAEMDLPMLKTFKIVPDLFGRLAYHSKITITLSTLDIS